MHYTIVYITAGDMTCARSIARELVEDHLAACVNMHPINSVYRWEGELVEEEGVGIFVKTTSDRLSRVKETVRSMHSDEVPCIVSWDISGDEEYLLWVLGQTRTQR